MCLANNQLVKQFNISAKQTGFNRLMLIISISKHIHANNKANTSSLARNKYITISPFFRNIATTSCASFFKYNIQYKGRIDRLLECHSDHLICIVFAQTFHMTCSFFVMQGADGRLSALPFGIFSRGFNLECAKQLVVRSRRFHSSAQGKLVKAAEVKEYCTTATSSVRTCGRANSLHVQAVDPS